MLLITLSIMSLLCVRDAWSEHDMDPAYPPLHLSGRSGICASFVCMIFRILLIRFDTWL